MVMVEFIVIFVDVLNLLLFLFYFIFFYLFIYLFFIFIYLFIFIFFFLRKNKIIEILNNNHKTGDLNFIQKLFKRIL